MITFSRFAFCVLVLMVAVGCASAKLTEREARGGHKKLPRPERIYVYPFAATPADIPTWSAAAKRYAPPKEPPTPEALEYARKLGDLVTKELIDNIVEMGLVALPGSQQSLPLTSRSRRFSRQSWCSWAYSSKDTGSGAGHSSMHPVRTRTTEPSARAPKPGTRAPNPKRGAYEIMCGTPGYCCPVVAR